MKDKIPVTLITDNMAGYFMKAGKIDIVVVGADRIAANGDTANKIGTYSVAVLAKENGIPFYVAAPTSTVDSRCESGEGIPIEERHGDEVIKIGDHYIAPKNVKSAYPAFDVTPAKYIAGIITEQGIAKPPYDKSLKKMVEKANKV
jgi:methylthioribose-1-phosphate isomerase